MKRIGKVLLRFILIMCVLLNVVVMFHAYKFTHFYEQNEITIKTQSEKTKWDITKEMLFGIKLPSGAPLWVYPLFAIVALVLGLPAMVFWTFPEVRVDTAAWYRSKISLPLPPNAFPPGCSPLKLQVPGGDASPPPEADRGPTP